MKTIVFHSYKGGVGRTLTLANLGYSLSRMGKKVVLLDLDVDAPSLHTKFERRGNFRGGYIDYLKQYYEPIEEKSRATTVVYEVMGAGIQERSDSLREYTLNVSKNLKIIPAGNPSQPMYWWNLGSTWLHFLLSLTREEISKVENGYPISNTLSRRFLEEEKNVIKALFGSGGADYLIVDCRSPREYSSVALIFWADIVVAMFNASSDGVDGFANIYRFVRRGREVSPTGEIARPRIIPVLCRVPEDFPDANAAQLNDDILAYLVRMQDPFGAELEPPGRLATLHEFRDLEQTERLLLNDRSARRNATTPAVRDVEALLSHDYVKLFCHIFEDEKEDVAGGVPLKEAKVWRRVLGLTEGAVARERFFAVRGSFMLNGDERNVAFRAKTILSWLASFKESKVADLKQRGTSKREIDRDVNKLFRNTGYNWGGGFGSEFMQLRRALGTPPSDVSELLATWCKFDYDAGFGQMTPTYDASKNCGKITWEGNFLDDGKKRQPHLMQFACGYISGVLQHLLPGGEGRVNVVSTGITSFAFVKVTGSVSGKPRSRQLPSKRKS